MDFTAEIYNSSITEPENFEKRWIINEVEEMIKGLERLLNENRNYEVINSYFHNNLRTSLLGRSLIRFKGERISGALIFLEKLKELHSICSDIELYIERIMKCNMSIYPRLSTEIEMMQKEHFKLNQDLSKILPEWTKCNNKQKEYDAIKKNINEEVMKDPKYPNNYVVSFDWSKGCVYIWQKETDRRFAEKHPEFQEFQKKYLSIKEQYDRLKKEIEELCKLINEFKGYQGTIFKYFDYLDRSKELTA